MTSIRTGKKRQQRTIEEVLSYRPTPASRTTVRNHYARWRKQQSIPPRCDIESCPFHTEPLTWLGRRLPLILDHMNGNNLDNRPKNLRYVCPNCDSQFSTRGGLNRGRVLEATEGGYALLSQEGMRHFYLIAETGRAIAEGKTAKIINGPSASQNS